MTAICLEFRGGIFGVPAIAFSPQEA